MTNLLKNYAEQLQTVLRPLYFLVENLYSTSETAYFRGIIALISALVISIVAQWAVYPVPLIATPHDIMVPLDAGWRVVSGQVPHNDFFSGLGPVFSYSYALGVKVFGPTVAAIVGVNLMIMVLTTSLAWLLSSHRLNPVVALLFSLTVMMTTSGVVPLGWGSDGTDYAMSYNRHAFGLFMLVCLWSFISSRNRCDGLRERTEDFIIGAIISYFLLLKLNFFVIGVSALLLKPLCSGMNFKGAAWILIGFLQPILFFWLILGVRPEAFIHDMTTIYNVAHEFRPPLLKSIGELIVQLTIPFLVALVVIIATGLFCLLKQNYKYQEIAKKSVAVFFLLAADLVLGVSNTQLPILVLLPIIAIILLQELLVVERRPTAVLTILIILTLSLSSVTIVRETKNVTYAAWDKLTTDRIVAKGQRFSSPLLSNIYIPPFMDGWVSDCPPFVNQGEEILKRHLRPGDKLVTIHFTNPFNFLLGLKPASGDSLWWHYGGSYSEAFHPQPDQLFSEADFVITGMPGRWGKVLPVYNDYLKKHYEVIEQSKWWTLHKRVRH